MADGFLEEFELPDDDFELPDVESEDLKDPEREPFVGLPDKTQQTRRHEYERAFMNLVAAVKREIKRIPQPFEFKLYDGSASWLGSDERARKWLDSPDDLAIWKLCYYGEDIDYAFGVRIRYACHFERLTKLPEWEFVFQVPPHYGSHQWFVGFTVQATKASLDRIRKVIDAVIEDFRVRREGR
jgi:hypothetical protein